MAVFLLFTASVFLVSYFYYIGPTLVPEVFTCHFIWFSFTCGISGLCIHPFLYSHYGRSIKMFGPPMAYWTGRFESKHRIAKGELPIQNKDLFLTFFVFDQWYYHSPTQVGVTMSLVFHSTKPNNIDQQQSQLNSTNQPF